MILTFQRLKLTFPYLNRKKLTVADFYAAADKFQVDIFEIRLKLRGYWFFDLAEKQDYIFLQKGQTGLKWLETAYHEIFHALGCSEYEANAFGLVAMIPQINLFDYSFLEDHPTRHVAKLFREREKVYFLYGV